MNTIIHVLTNCFMILAQTGYHHKEVSMTSAQKDQARLTFAHVC